MEQMQKILDGISFEIFKKAWLICIEPSEETVNLIGAELYSQKYEESIQKLKNEKEQEEKKYCKRTFGKMMKDTLLEEHAEQLWALGIILNIVERDRNQALEIESKEIDARIGALEALLFLIRHEKTDDIKLSAPDSSLSIKGIAAIDYIKRGLVLVLKEEEKLQDFSDKSLSRFLTENKELREKLGHGVKRGAPIKSHLIVYLLYNIKSIFKGSPSNNDFRRIYDYCNFFGFIPNEVATGHEYIKSIYNSYKEIINAVKTEG